MKKWENWHALFWRFRERLGSSIVQAVVKNSWTRWRT